MRRNQYGTPFAETEALLAVMAGDIKAGRQIVGGMDKTERQSLAKACDRLSGILNGADVPDRVNNCRDC